MIMQDTPGCQGQTVKNVINYEKIQAAQKGPDARPQLNRGATNEAYSLPYAAMTSDDEQQSRWAFFSSLLIPSENPPDYIRESNQKPG